MDREALTFEQAEGLAPLPSQLALGELSSEFRANLWALLYTVIGLRQGRVVDPWVRLLRDYHVYYLHRMIDEFTSEYTSISLSVKSLIQNGKYSDILGFLQYILRHEQSPGYMQKTVERLLVDCRTAYRLVGGRTIVPMASEMERQAIETAFVDLNKAGLYGARKHLELGAEYSSSGKWADSVRESVHAVESTARAIAVGEKGLEPALRRLEETAAIHNGLKKGFGSIYGFTSEEKGIRHPLIDDANAKVDETDALFMLSACAAFVSYLIGKARTAGILNN